MRFWGKIIRDNHILMNVTITDDSEETRTHKVLHTLEQICHEWDLSVPIWLDSNIREFKRTKKVRFTQDSFVGEELSFDYLELQVLDED